MAKAAFETPRIPDFPEIPVIVEGGDGPQPSVRRRPRPSAGARLPGRAGRRLARCGHREDGRAGRQVPGPARLPRFVRQVRRVYRQVPLLPRHGGSEEHAGGAAGPVAQGVPAPLHARRQAVPQARRRRRPHRGGARGLVPLLPSVLAVPAVLGVLPLRHRHRRDIDGRPRDPRERRPGAEVQQRDHRQGPQDRQQSRAAAASARRHPGRARGGRRGRYGG